MEVLRDTLEAVIAKDSWSSEDQNAILNYALVQGDAIRALRQILEQIQPKGVQPSGATALKVGAIQFMLCNFADARETLSKAGDNKERRYLQAMCCKMLNRFDKAIEELDCAKDRGGDALAIDLQIAEIKALSGDLDGASKMVARLENKAGQTARYVYIRGLILELQGQGAKAVEAYEQARTIDPGMVEPTFRLAYYCDLHGEEQQAIELYKECISRTPVHVSALMNAAILYEDAEHYGSASSCLRRVLHAIPNHQRARLFLKDVEASDSMFYDEDHAKRIARRNAVLDIPVTDFELSVRARNCLKKMNIRSLGDLVRITEPELLGYKNFGETSLKEIKEMMASKGLRLGQAREEEGDISQLLSSSSPAPSGEGDEGLLATSLDQIEFSVRARKAMGNLQIKTLGDLAGKSEVELMACRNFGQTSLNEIRQRLAEYGLQLKESR